MKFNSVMNYTAGVWTKLATKFQAQQCGAQPSAYHKVQKE